MNRNDAIRILKAKGEEFDFFNQTVESLARMLADRNLSHTQIRKILEMIRKVEYEQKKNKEIKSITPNCLKSLLLLKPKLLYMAERQTALYPLQEAIKTMIDLLVQSKSLGEFNNFVSFLEAVVAYHYHFEEEKKRNRRKRR